MIRRLLLAAILTVPAGTAQADEQAFLASLEGDWTGRGSVRLRADSAPINVSCSFDTKSAGPALSMRGRCRGLILVSRSISADLRADGANYRGTYVGPKGGHSKLTGTRRGNAVNLAVRWAVAVNGDHHATMILRRVGENGMQLTTIDVDPASGKRVATSEINLRRR
ncbi:hypothetical protein [Ensifer sp. LCM 4579]|uniref:hypothetical protein n=1 Tax=Ensifer sp. LCM 4579 TaxID=1848292 RepID=UPI000AF9AEBF|nr:hypothetical protein [Ensifer sp. LCM 4579]